jgi:hypothetical protein
VARIDADYRQAKEVIEKPRHFRFDPQRTLAGPRRILRVRPL